MTHDAVSSKKPRVYGRGITYWTPAEAMPLDVFSYIREAGKARDSKCFMASIAMSSALVELIINRDSRTRTKKGLRRVAGWATLNNANLSIAKGAGLPVHKLLRKGEDVAQVAAVEFVRLRNKVAHGDTLGLFTTLTHYES